MPHLVLGSLADPAVQAGLAKAQANPAAWELYLIHQGEGRRTEAQNRFFRILLRKFAQQSGQSVAYWHDYLVERFLGLDEVMGEDGYTYKVLPSSGDQTVAQFSSFLNACLVLASELHIDL